MKLGLVSSAYPPDIDGLGDYNWWMVKTLSEMDCIDSPVQVFTRPGHCDNSLPNVRVTPFFNPDNPSTFRRLYGILASQPSRPFDWITIQYNPFSWGKRGFCPWVPETLRRIRKLPNAPKIAIMFHETMVPRWPWRFSVMHSWQLPIFRMVCRAADVAFVSSERWIPQVAKAFSGAKNIHHLPVGSNIPLSAVTSGEARRRLGISLNTVVLGMFGSAHCSRLLDWTAAAARRVAAEGLDVLLLYIGPEGRQLLSASPGIPVRDCGALPMNDVGWHLRAMNLMVSPFVDGISTRRGSVMAALQHGIPTATTISGWSDQIFRKAIPDSLMLCELIGPENFAAKICSWIKERKDRCAIPDPALSGFYSDNFSWRVLSEKKMQLFEHHAKVKRG